jgi:MYXO-CTERM domain-containing protein
MSKSTFALGAIAALGMGAAASAEFVGVYADSYAVNVSGADYAVIDIYIQFDNSADTVLNLFNTEIFNMGGSAFHHNDFNTLSGQPGTWSVQQTANLPALGLVPDNDSFVLIGGPIGSANNTALDPSFSPATAPVPPLNAGWFTSNPPALQGRADATTLRTFVGRFVKAGIDTAEALSFAFNMGYNQGLGTPAVFAYANGAGRGPAFEIAYVPAPGALALLGLAGLAGRRRRG